MGVCEQGTRRGASRAVAAKSEAAEGGNRRLRSARFEAVLAKQIAPALASAFLGAVIPVPLVQPGDAAPTLAMSPRRVTIHKVMQNAVRIQIACAGEVLRSATGVAFAREGADTYVLTNAHVVEPSPTWKGPVEIHVLASGRRAPLVARVVERGHVPDVDLALLAVADSSLPLARLAADDSLEVGDDLVVVGAPFGKGLSVAAGIVSQVEYEPEDGAVGARRPRMLKTDAAIGYGSSGGGVFDVPSGRLIGLVEGYRTARVSLGHDKDYFDVPMPGETFVAPAAKIRRFLGERGLARLAPSVGDGGGPPAVAPVVAPAVAPAVVSEPASTSGLKKPAP
jgi:serine protease Do